MRSTRALRPLLLLTWLALPVGALQAQRYWHDDQGGNAFRLDVGYPLLKGDNHKFPTFAAVPSLSIRAAEGIRVEGDFPLVRAGYDFGAPTGSVTSFRVGNPFVGFRVGDDDKHFSGMLGARLPLAAKPKDAIGQKAVEAGAITTFDDYEAFTPNIATIRAALEGRWADKDGFLVGAKLGGSILIATGGNPLAQTVKYLDYGLRVGYSGAVQATAAFTGRLISQSTTGESGLSARTHGALTGALELRKGTLRPRASFRLPLDKDLTDVAGSILGFGVTLMR